MLDIQQIIYVWDLFFQYKFNHDVVWWLDYLIW
jgi:hypothetical protein